jgi:hypothetical protein
MLNNAYGTLVNMLKKKIKDKNKNDKISIYTFEILNAQFLKKIL